MNNLVTNNLKIVMVSVCYYLLLLFVMSYNDAFLKNLYYSSKAQINTTE